MPRPANKMSSSAFKTLLSHPRVLDLMRQMNKSSVRDTLMNLAAILAEGLTALGFFVHPAVPEKDSLYYS